jgi:hypothetical protein
MIEWLYVIVALAFFAMPGFTLLQFLKFSRSERIIFAFPVGLILVSLTIYFLNNFGMPINQLTVITTTLVLTILIYWRYKVWKKTQ